MKKCKIVWQVTYHLNMLVETRRYPFVLRLSGELEAPFLWFCCHGDVAVISVGCFSPCGHSRDSLVEGKLVNPFE